MENSEINKISTELVIEESKKKIKKKNKIRNGFIGDTKYVWEEVNRDKIDLPEIVFHNLEKLIMDIDSYLSFRGIGYKLIFSKIYQKDTKFDSGLIVKVYCPSRSPNLIFKDFKLFKGSVGLARDGIEVGYSVKNLRYISS